jgi:hypothetical protein
MWINGNKLRYARVSLSLNSGHPRELGWFDDVDLFVDICLNPALVPANNDFETWLQAILNTLDSNYGQHWKRC